MINQRQQDVDKRQAKAKDIISIIEGKGERVFR
jgi:hypothetical protein